MATLKELREEQKKVQDELDKVTLKRLKEVQNEEEKQKVVQLREEANKLYQKLARIKQEIEQKEKEEEKKKKEKQKKRELPPAEVVRVKLEKDKAVKKEKEIHLEFDFDEEPEPDEAEYQPVKKIKDFLYMSEEENQATEDEPAQEEITSESESKPAQGVFYDKWVGREKEHELYYALAQGLRYLNKHRSYKGMSKRLDSAEIKILREQVKEAMDLLDTPEKSLQEEGVQEKLMEVLSCADEYRYKKRKEADLEDPIDSDEKECPDFLKGNKTRQMRYKGAFHISDEIAKCYGKEASVRKQLDAMSRKVSEAAEAEIRENGEEADLSELAAKKIVINNWTNWVKEKPELGTLTEEKLEKASSDLQEKEYFKFMMNGMRFSVIKSGMESLHGEALLQGLRNAKEIANRRHGQGGHKATMEGQKIEKNVAAF